MNNIKSRNIFFLLLLVSNFSFAETESQVKTEQITSDKKSVENKEEKSEEKKVDEEAKWQFGVGLSIGSKAKVKYDKITYSDSTATSTADLEYSSAASVELDARYMRKHSWGFIGGITFDAERKCVGGTITTGGTTYTPNTSNPSKIKATVFYANAVYLWQSFYIPFGFNYSAIKFTPSSLSTSTASADGGLGAQLGIGGYVTHHIALEAVSRLVGIRLKATSVAGAVTDYGDGFMSTVQLTVKYFF